MSYELETEIRARISELHNEYQERIRPYMEMLARIESMKPRTYFIDYESLPEHVKKSIQANADRVFGDMK